MRFPFLRQPIQRSLVSYRIHTPYYSCQIACASHNQYSPGILHPPSLCRAASGATRDASCMLPFCRFEYHNISVIDGAASVRGHLYERQVLNYLCGIRTKRTFSIRGLTESNQRKWTYRGPIQRITFQETTFFNEITKAVRNRKPLHLVPADRYFPAVDSILYDPNDPNVEFTCIQITTSKNHAIAVSGLQHIQSWLKPPLDGLRPTKTRPWRFLFVVPSHKVSNFKLQKLDGDTASGEWAGKVHQYVLGLEECELYSGEDPIRAYSEQSPHNRGSKQMMDLGDT